MNTIKKPMVSVICMTYNHEEFIRDSINGFLLQKTDFSVEILVHDDASTDNTVKILKDYESRHPGLINVIYQKENQYSKGKKMFSSFMLPQAKGKYIALCEGDDYWTDPLKLQKQVDFLENNPDFSICFHKTSRMENNIIDDEVFKDYHKEIMAGREEFYIEDLLKVNFIATCSVVFRKNFEVFPEWYNCLAFGDWPLHILNSQFGKVKYIDEAMAVYRVHGKGIYSSRTPRAREEAIFKFFKIINRHFDYKYNDLIFDSILNKYLKSVDYSSDLLEAKTWFEDRFNKALEQLTYNQKFLAQLLNSRKHKDKDVLKKANNFLLFDPSSENNTISIFPRMITIEKNITLTKISILKIDKDLYGFIFNFVIKRKLKSNYIVYFHGFVDENNIGQLPAHRQEYGFENWDFSPYPTTSFWAKGEIIIPTVISAKSGKYHIKTGFYDLEKNEQFGNEIDLGEISF